MWGRPVQSGTQEVRPDAGMTIVEVLIVAALSAMVMAGMYYAAILGTRLNYTSAQRLAAFGICKDMFEQMRGSQTYSNINVNVYSTRVVRVTHLGGSARVPLYGTNSCRIVDLNNPTRKRVTVSVSWVYQGRPLTESLDGVIYFKK